jgi:hypothetical protein
VGGVGLAESEPKNLLGKLLKTKELRQRWQETRVLVVYEISMWGCYFFDLLIISAAGSATRASRLAASSSSSPAISTSCPQVT